MLPRPTFPNSTSLDHEQFPNNTSSDHEQQELVLHRRLDAVEVLQMTLEDAVQVSNNPRKSTVLSRLDMCRRFLQSTPWGEERGAANRINGTLSDLHARLSKDGSVVGLGMTRRDWEELGRALSAPITSTTPLPALSSTLSGLDTATLQGMVADRVAVFLSQGPVAFGSSNARKLLERITLCQRNCDAKLLDTRRLEHITSDILSLVTRCGTEHEVMELWEKIDFSKWALKSLQGFSVTVRTRKVYTQIEIEQGRRESEDYWRRVFARTAADFEPPVMMKGYPVHPYYFYEKMRNSSKNVRSPCKERYVQRDSAGKFDDNITEHKRGDKDSSKPCPVAVATHPSKSPVPTPSHKPLQPSQTTPPPPSDRDIWISSFLTQFSAQHNIYSARMRQFQPSWKGEDNATVRHSPRGIRLTVPRLLKVQLVAGMNKLALNLTVKLKKCQNDLTAEEFEEIIVQFRKSCKEESELFLTQLRSFVRRKVGRFMPDSEKKDRHDLREGLIQNMDGRVRMFSSAASSLGTFNGRDMFILVKNFFKSLAFITYPETMMINTKYG